MPSLSEANAFKIELWRSELHIHEEIGVRVDVNGRPMVALPCGVIVGAESWHCTMPDAKRAAADKIDAIRSELAETALRLRTEANQLEATRA